MTTRKKRRNQEEAARAAEQQSTAAAPNAVDGPGLLRRWLLGMVAALVVARPLVPGEDPGLLAPDSAPSGLVLTLGWFLAVLVWAGWRLWSGRGVWYAGLVELGLLVAAVVAFAAAGAATYKHPATLIAWEWLALVAALFVVRQLAVTEEDQRGLFAAVLASAVSLSIFAAYQYAVYIPDRADRSVPDPNAVARSWRETGEVVGIGGHGPIPAMAWLAGVSQSSGEASSLENAYRRLQDNPSAKATFAHPNTFAGLLALLLPALLAAVVLRWRAGDDGLMIGATAVCALLSVWALYTTHSRGALLGLGLAGLGAGLVLGRRWLRAHKGLAISAVAVVAALALLVWQQGWPGGVFGKGDGTVRNRLDNWSATWAMIRDHLWLGVGPGNFGRTYPRYMMPEAYETITDPHNFALELWATLGIVGLVAVLVALAAYFVTLARRAKAAASEGRTPAADTSTPRRRTRWEFYVGGMLGLLLGHFLSVASTSPEGVLQGIDLKSPDRVLRDGLEAGLRAVVWFAAFALFEGVPWTGRQRALALGAGIVALLVNLSVSGGIGFPSLAMFLWVAVALALNGLNPRPRGSEEVKGISRGLPFALTAGFVLAYALYVFVPVVSGSVKAVEAMEAARIYTEAVDDRSLRMRDPTGYLEAMVVTKLGEARASDGSNARLQVHYSHQTTELWKRYRNHPTKGPHWFRVSLGAAEEAQRLDPRGIEGYLAEYRLRVIVARHMKREEDRRSHFQKAAEALKRFTDSDPNNPRWHFGIAEVFLELGDRETAREEARKALELDALSEKSPRRLGLWQRWRAESWATLP